MQIKLINIMKIIITEHQYRRFLMEGDIFTDEKEYQIALKKYNEQFKIYKESLDYLNYLKNIKMKTGWCNDNDNHSEYLKLIKESYSEQLFKKGKKNNMKIDKNFKVHYCSGCEKKNNILVPTVLFSAVGQREPYSPLGCCPDCWASGYIFKKPVKPIFKPIVKPVVNPVVNKKVEPVVQPVNNMKGNDGNSVFGPGNSLIGFMNKGKFTPAYGDYLKGMNKADKDLLNNKQELIKYIKSKFGEYYNPNL